MKDFAAIDFETANNERTSVCSVVTISKNTIMPSPTQKPVPG